MDEKALFSLSYGIFMLGTKVGEKINGCITNTCIQVASNPTRVAISVLNSNFSCQMIKDSGYCTISILDESITFDTIKHFGMQSGRNVNKFEDMTPPTDKNGIPYLGWGTCAVLSLKIVSSQDLDSHTLFIAEVEDAFKTSENKPVTYAYYQSNIKPKPKTVQNDKKIVGWRCKICGYVYEGKDLPKDFTCPLCGHDASDFEPIYES